MDAVASAQRIADEVLFPAALATDAADTVPAELLDELATAGLYGIGAEEFETACRVVEALASGCLTTTFVWVQHFGAARAAAMSENPAMAEWAPVLASGERRAGLALGGALPLIVANEAAGG